MAGKSKQLTPPSNGEFRLCRGGRSFMCRKVIEEPGKDSGHLGPHQPQREISPRTTSGPVLAAGGYHCRRCNQYLGCYWCAQRLSELVCLNCHDWADDAGEREHGKMISRELAAAKVGELVAGIGRA